MENLKKALNENWPGLNEKGLKRYAGWLNKQVDHYAKLHKVDAGKLEELVIEHMNEKREYGSPVTNFLALSLKKGGGEAKDPTKLTKKADLVAWISEEVDAEKIEEVLDEHDAEELNDLTVAVLKEEFINE